MTAPERDVEVHLPDRPGALAEFGVALGRAGVSVEGGGVFTHAGVGVAHFLVADGAAAVIALESAGLPVVSVSPVVTVRLDQGTPGQLGALAERMARAGVNIRVQYSDHDHRLVLVVAEADRAAAQAVARAVDRSWAQVESHDRPHVDPTSTGAESPATQGERGSGDAGGRGSGQRTG